jgi:hypothetical protein
MGSLLITIEDPRDKELILALVQRLKLSARELSEEEMRFLARVALALTPDSTVERPEFSEEEIQEEVDAVREKRQRYS